MRTAASAAIEATAASMIMVAVTATRAADAASNATKATTVAVITATVTAEGARLVIRTPVTFMAVELAAVLTEMRSTSAMTRRQGTAGVSLGRGKRAR